uniref:Protein takeout n=1 Tax=Lygus hesperus TaxID=30085 RepID=A0A0A9VS64_LYGHE
MLFFVLLSCLVVGSRAASTDLPLPSYMKLCKKADFDSCVLANSAVAIKGLWNGDKKYKIPQIDPYKIIKVAIADSGNKNIALNLTFTDLVIHGLRSTKMVGSKTDFEKKHLEWDFEMPHLEFKGKQKTSGKFLLLPVQGEGPANFELDKLKAKYTIEWDLETRKGKQWMKFRNGNFKTDLEGLTVDFQGLFNGDKALGKNINTVINDNWRELYVSVGPPFAKAMATIVYQLIDGISKVVPFENMVG